MTREPGIRRAGLWLFFVVKAEVAQNLGPQSISWNDFRQTMKHSTRLKKVNRAGHIGRNNAIILPGLGDAVHLNREQDGNALFLQLAGKRHDRRCAPTVAIEDDAGLPPL